MKRGRGSRAVGRTWHGDPLHCPLQRNAAADDVCQPRLGVDTQPGGKAWTTQIGFNQRHAAARDRDSAREVEGDRRLSVTWRCRGNQQRTQLTIEVEVAQACT